LNNISLRNGIDPTWKDRNNFNSARIANEKCALKVEAYFNIAKNVYDINLTHAMIIGIVNNFERGNKNGKELRNVYCNDKYAEIMSTAKFENDFVKIMKFMKLIDNNNIRKIAVVRTIVRNIIKLEGTPNWDKITIAFTKYLKKNRKDYEYFGDKQYHFNKIANGVIGELVNL
jgi:hypothetical protein